METYPSNMDFKVAFGSKSHPECAAYSPDGTMIASGSVDGFIEVREAGSTAGVCGQCTVLLTLVLLFCVWLLRLMSDQQEAPLSLCIGACTRMQSAFPPHLLVLPALLSPCSW